MDASDTMGFVTGPKQAPASIEELSRVRLKQAYRAGDVDLPAGSTGTVVHRYRNGDAFEVEFVEPIVALVTLERSQVTRET